MKKLKILLPILIILAVIAGVAYYVISNNALAITKRSKVGKGIAKTLTEFENSDEIIEENAEFKYLKNIGSKPYEDEIEWSFDVDIDNLEDLMGVDKDTAKKIEDVIDEITNSSLATKLSLDKENKQMLVELDAKAEDIFGELTGEVVVTEDEIAFRSKEINKEFLKITEEDAEDNEELEEVFDLIKELFERDYSDLMFSKEEIKHFKETYLGILEDFITNDLITTENAEVTVDGETKSCTKTITKFDNEKFKALLLKYVTTYEEDKEGKEILTRKFKNIYGDELANEMLKNMDSSIDEIKDAINDIEDTTFEFITYGTVTEVYQNEYKLTVDGESASLKQIFNSDNTKYIVVTDDEEVLTVTSKKVDGGVELTIETDAYGEDVKATVVLTTSKIALNVDLGDAGTFGFTADIDVKKDTNKEFSQVIDFTIDVDIPDEDIKGSAKITMKENLKVLDSIDLPDTSNAISVFDETKLEKYAKDAESNAKKIVEKIEKSKVYKLYEELNYGSGSSYGSYSYDLDDDYTFKTSTDTAKEAAAKAAKYAAQDDITLAYSSCLLDYQEAWAGNKDAKKEDYTKLDNLNKNLYSGKITKYDEKTGKGTYESNKGDIYEFTLKDGVATIED